MRRRVLRWLTIAVYGYSATVLCLWLTVRFLADRVWPATLVAFGPRWLAAVPLLPLALLVFLEAPVHSARKLPGLLALTAVVVVLGLLDFRMGLGRAVGTPTLRLMTHNVGEGAVTAVELDRLMKVQGVDIAVLQECPFYNNDMQRFGWRFYYGGDLCLVSRYPFRVLDERDPDNAWRTGGHEANRFEIDGPIGRFQLLNVHLGTIRSGLDALHAGGPGALSRFLENRDEVANESHRTRERTKGGILPVVVAGDFNLPVESAIYRSDWGDLRNSFSTCGRGFGHTKFTRLFGIRIDHVLTSYQFACADARVLSSPYGGDHAPLVVDLVLVH